MLNKLVSAIFWLPVVLSIDIEPPLSHENNTWYVENLDFSHIIDSTGGIKASFSIYRTYYQECLGKAPDGLEKLVRCGWIIVDSPLSCYPTDYAGTGTSLTMNPPQDRWYTCHERLKAAEGDRLLSDDEKQWLKWRSFDLQQLDISRLSRDELPAGPFQNVSFEFVNGIRTFRNGSRLPADQIRVIKSIFSVPRSWMNCWLPGAPVASRPVNNQWYCQLGASKARNLNGHYCKGLLGTSSPCGFLTAAQESFMSLPEFKQTYT